jgi:hypothetical protein
MLDADARDEERRGAGGAAGKQEQGPRYVSAYHGGRPGSYR